MVTLLTLLVLACLAGKTSGVPTKGDAGCPVPLGQDYHSADTERCDIFYKCDHGRWVQQDCPGGLNFDPGASFCRYPFEYPCPHCPVACDSTHGTCDAANSRCECNDGYEGPACDQDLNECQAGTHNCAQNCINDDGGFTCGCDPGFVLNADDISCDPVVCTPACENGGTCEDNGTCTCGPGFTGDTCTDIDFCFAANCQNGAGCRIEGGQAICECPAAYTGSQCETEITSTCATAGLTCANNGECSDSTGTAECLCRNGFTGPTCQQIVGRGTDCSTTTLVCNNGGQCYDGNGAPECLCPNGYTGESCDDVVGADPCDGVVCENGGVCDDSSGTAECVCQPGFEGPNCGVQGTGCSRVSCLNGGTCQESATGELSCDCADGFGGQFCEFVVDCTTVTCLNGGTCALQDSTAGCDCLPGTSGDNCEFREDCAADGSTCSNHGDCVDTDAGFVCACDFGWMGVTCETIRTCANSFITCENGGTCEDTADGASCSCADGFIGPYCDLIDDECGGCENGGVCRTPAIFPIDSDVKTCACPAGYTGDRCETASTCTIPCHPDVGKDGSRQEVLLFPDVDSNKHLFICREGLLQRVEACPDTSYNIYTTGCLSIEDYIQALQVTNDAFYPPN